jgi:hypothetical protein
MNGWRREVLGAELVSLMNGSSRIELACPNGVLNAVARPEPMDQSQ